MESLIEKRSRQSSQMKMKLISKIRKCVLGCARMIFWLIKICRNKLMFGVLIAIQEMCLLAEDGKSIII